ncbi:Sir2 family NAD-dependent protein deacetylase [Microbacterium gorillae]|uniref:Sir2 family NAD-dependent protein deacetylase n=1 Tax=Microbacterium gorillae TaxID=1231063 RepID=UPI0006939369|nr:Sir2 family NAD-dependent protein deacetylase [Microbacterium gorillae]
MTADAQDLDRAADLLGGGRLAVLTGAGVSTDSGIPDYRGEGAPVRTPMTVSRFLAQDDADRRRYWAGGELGWHHFASRRPNLGHRVLAAWERDGRVAGIITQNVDGLHQKAGSTRVVELHGTGARVVCLRCGQTFDRRDVSARIAADNPHFDLDATSRLGPDGDMVPADTDRFVVPICTVCGGMVRPDVVFFGEYVPAPRFALAAAVVDAADALLVAGSSLTVNTGVRLVERARRRGIPVVVINRGRTRMDGRVDLKLDAGVSETLPAIAAHWGTSTDPPFDRAVRLGG